MPRSEHLRALGLAALLAPLHAAPAAHAEPPATAVAAPSLPVRVTAPLWSGIEDTDAHRARSLLLRARKHMREAVRAAPADWLLVCARTVARARLDETPAAHRGRLRALSQLLRATLKRQAHLDNALRRIERARALRPADPDTLLMQAQALSMWEHPGPLWGCTVRRRDAEAVEVLQRLQTLHPTRRASEVAFQLGVLHTRTGDFEQAREAYAQAAALALDRDEEPTILTNLAEVTMLSGDLFAALSHYERAAEASDGGRDYLLAIWGQAIALDRLGEHEAAVEHARRAVEAEGGHMRVLRSDGVFFNPAYEIHYYEALGAEALAAVEPDEADAHLVEAMAHWRAFLQASVPQDDFHAAAASNLERLRSAHPALQRDAEGVQGAASTSAVTLP